MICSVARKSLLPIPNTMLSTLVVSDAFDAAAHLLGAQLCFKHNDVEATIGMLLLAVSAIIGTIRYAGFERLAPLHKSVADVSMFLGTPLIGYRFLVAFLWDYVP